VRFWPSLAGSWEHAAPLLTGVVRCGPVVRGPNVAPDVAPAVHLSDPILTIRVAAHM
jgi:hypothetical protein